MSTDDLFEGYEKIGSYRDLKPGEEVRVVALGGALISYGTGSLAELVFGCKGAPTWVLTQSLLTVIRDGHVSVTVDAQVTDEGGLVVHQKNGTGTLFVRESSLAEWSSKLDLWRKKSRKKTYLPGIYVHTVNGENTNDIYKVSIVGAVAKWNQGWKPAKHPKNGVLSALAMDRQGPTWESVEVTLED